MNSVYSLRLLAEAHEKALLSEAAEYRQLKDCGGCIAADLRRLGATVLALAALAAVSWVYPI